MAQPGTVSVTRPQFASDFPRVLSAHDIGLRDLLETAALLGPWPRMFLVTVSIAAGQSPGVELSSPVLRGHRPCDRADPDDSPAGNDCRIVGTVGNPRPVLP